jgi:transcriptional regulator with XRE-family HTH domain
VTPETIGWALRSLRRRKGWRQVDLAARVGVSQPAVSAAECGRLDEISLSTLRRLFEACGGDLVVTVRWRGGELDRLLDRAHAELVERIARRLTQLGWEVFVEVSFSRYGERGSIDILGWHAHSLTALIVEVKASISGVEETLRRHDVKVRLAPVIVYERLGVRPTRVARLLIAPDTSTIRRRIEDHAETFRRAYPARGREVTRWLKGPAGPMAGILLLREAAARPARRRVRTTQQPGLISPRDPAA